MRWSPLGKPEGRYLDKLRTIRDATVNQVNKWIRLHQLEKTTSPGLHEALYAMFFCRFQKTTLLKLDITKAHRRIKILPKDWKYMVAVIGDEYWINTVGAYGVASAQLYWGRMAALLTRLLYYTFPQILWVFVYVDDFLFLLPEQDAQALTAAIVNFLHALGVPISWKKSTEGHINHWLGYQLNCQTLTATLTPDKHLTIISLLHNIELSKPRTFKDLESELGKLNWALMICPPLRPLMTPLYAWLMAMRKQLHLHNRTGRPNKECRLLAYTARKTLNDKPASIIPTEPLAQFTSATDAGADDTKATIGGWYSSNKTPNKNDVHWFIIEMNNKDHPWAFEELTPQRSISAIELYGTLVLHKHLAQKGHLDNHTQLPIRTDNQGNTYNVMNYKAKQWPNYGILLEMSLTHYHTTGRPHVTHIQRELNTWADQLTHRDATGFNADLEIKNIEHNLTWHILKQLVQLHQRMDNKATASPKQSTHKPKPQQPKAQEHQPP